jgi:signal transduction histidine kinase
MRLFWSLGRAFSKPLALWFLFAVVLALSTGGLWLLSRHSLRLSYQQSISEQREDLQQNIRVALWRLDSRLGPYIATLHDPSAGTTVSSPADEFVIERFRIERRPAKVKGLGQFAFAPYAPNHAMTEVGTTNDHWQRLIDEIPVQAVVAAVDELIPNIDSNPTQSLVQSYDVQTDSLDQISQRELGNRSMWVQQQVAMNAAPIEVSGSREKGASPRGDNTKLMSVWIDEHLVVVRSGRTFAGELEGVWVDWPSLRQSLASDVADLVPAAEIQPVRQSETIDPARTLAAIPAMVLPPAEAVIAPPWSPTHTALLLAWFALVVSALIAAVALSRLIALSERRASFVSAVTHELRTPLTTFRLYSDLLARDMVSDPSDRKEYLETLRREADRLTHLVDNVLRYSKLQRTFKRAALETVVLSEWIQRITPRLTARLAAADMTLVVSQTSDGRWNTDPPAMEQVLFNLIDNAAKYAQTATDRRVHLDAEIDDSSVVLTVSDHGPGVPASLRSAIFRPFAKSAERAAETAAGVGLGLALAKQTALNLGGKLSYREAGGGGASFRLVVPTGPDN